MEEQTPTQEIATVSTEQQPVKEEPIKDVGTFWERLDEVLQLVKSGGVRSNIVEDILEAFPEMEKIKQDYKSAIFQPDRLALCSNDDIQGNTNLNTPFLPFNERVGHYPGEKFSSFRVRLTRPLRNVKQIQLLSAVIPNAIQNIPDEQVFFFWYKLRSVALANLGAYSAVTTYKTGDIVSYNTLNYVNKTQSLNITPGLVYWVVTTTLPATSVWAAGTIYNTGAVVSYNNQNWVCQVNATQNVIPGTTYWVQITLPADTSRPNYYDLNPNHINYLWLAPSYYFPYEYTLAANPLLFNRTFQDYDDLVNTLNFIISQDNILNNAQNDISFQYNPTLNKIIMIPNPANLTAGYYYLPCGYEDPNLASFMSSNRAIYGLQEQFAANYLQYNAGYTLNLRLGFTWNGIYTNPFLTNPWSDNNFMGSLFWYMRKQDPGFNPPLFLPVLLQDIITFNSYPDLVNTSCVRINADFALSSTQDSLGSTIPDNNTAPQGLLSIVPVNASNLGVGFYQNNFNNPLTKIPQNLTEIGISMLTDQGLPYYLPNSATVLLELAVEYN